MEWRVIFCTELSSAERDEPKEKGEEGSDPVCLLNLRSREGRKLILPHGVSPPSHLSPREGRLLSKSEGQVYYCGFSFSRSGLLLCPSVKAHVDENSNMLDERIVHMPLP